MGSEMRQWRKQNKTLKTQLETEFKILTVSLKNVKN